MTRAGWRLRALAARWCDETTMARVVDPAIADLQFELDEASARRSALEYLRVWFAGQTGFWKVLAWQLITGHAGAGRRAVEQTSPLVRLALVTALAVAFATMAFDGLVFVRLSQLLGARQPITVAVGFAIRALPLSIPVALMTVILWSRGRSKGYGLRSVLTVAAVASIVSFVVQAWIGPLAGQRFRETMTGYAMAQGVSELTLGELRHLVMTQPLVTPLVRCSYEMRWSFAAAPLALACFAHVTADRWRRRRWWTRVIGVVGGLGYFGLLVWTARLGMNGEVPAVVAAWVPNGVIAVLSIALSVSATRPGSAMARPRTA
jgi:hypothetical protein